MLRIRFLRIGRKHHPSFKLVVTDQKNPPKGGRFVEQVGFYNPLTKEKKVDGDRVKYWMERGAQPSDTVHNLLVAEGVLEQKKVAVHATAKKKKGDEEEAAESADAAPPAGGSAEGGDQPAAETPAEEVPTEEPKEEPEAEEKKEPASSPPADETGTDEQEGGKKSE